tara:strand:+ start:147 stop:650 length:504 start_codon:yes stop_codon:yes gene_type:complete
MLIDEERFLTDQQAPKHYINQNNNIKIKLANFCSLLKNQCICIFNICKNLNIFNISVLLFLLINLILSSITLHYMSNIQSIINEFVPKINKQVDDAYELFNEDSNKVTNITDMIMSDEFKTNYHKVGQIINTISINDIDKINTLLSNMDPKQVDRLINKLCDTFECN